jgi:hypothetical protein
MCIFCGIGNKSQYVCCPRGDEIAEFLLHDYDYILQTAEGRKFAFDAYNLSDNDFSILMINYLNKKLGQIKPKH